MELNSSVAAVVTGGASGLGEASARALRAKGCKVAIFDMNEELGEKVAAEIGAIFCKVNITSDEDVDAGFAKARAANGQERVIINCAGGGSSEKTVGRDRETRLPRHADIATFARVCELNLVGTFRMIAKGAMGMMELEPLEDGERGAIVNTGSIAAQDGRGGQAAYAGSKAGIVGMTLPIARDLMKEGIRINTILPGIMDTPPMNRVKPEVKDALAASVPFPKRLGKPSEFAELALLMCSNSYFNAETVRLDGGILLPA